jgi:hypothetical protein
MGEYRGRCCICQTPQQLMDEEDEPILCYDCERADPKNRLVFDKLLQEKRTPPKEDRDERRWKNLCDLSKTAAKR